MTGCSLEGARPVRPGILRILRTFYRLRHDFYLCHALATLSMSSSDAGAARIATTDDKNVLALAVDELVLAELHACEDAVLLR